MSRKWRIRLSALATLALAIWGSATPRTAEASAMLCPENIEVSSCNDIPPWIYSACDGCFRPVTCGQFFNIETMQYYWAAGCEFES